MAVNGHKIGGNVALDLMGDINYLTLAAEVGHDLYEALQKNLAGYKKEKKKKERREETTGETASSGEETLSEMHYRLTTMSRFAIRQSPRFVARSAERGERRFEKPEALE